MNTPAELRYATSHEWTRLEGDIATVGISDHAQAELTDVVFVELPALGRSVDAGDPTAVVESVKAASDIYAPVSGEIVEVNPLVEADPSLSRSIFTYSSTDVRSPLWVSVQMPRFTSPWSERVLTSG